MAFLMSCTNKGCGKSSEVAYDSSDDQVYCTECDRPITNITSFVKTQLKSLKQIKKPKKDAFSVACLSCKTVMLPVVIDKQLACPKCKKAHTTIPKPFERLLRQKIQDVIKEDQDENKS